ncbi:hypothetical protein AI17_004892 [Salmonella enterica subsp. enterica serovar Oslo]|nr:hypothetical protein [Salmonella enterica subsp. enterica serovar Oslo]
MSEEASLLRFRHKPPYAPVLHNTPAWYFPDNPVRGTIPSQYTLRYRSVTGSGLRPETR